MEQQIDIARAMRSLAVSGASIALVGAAVVLLLQAVWGAPQAVVPVELPPAAAEAPR